MTFWGQRAIGHIIGVGSGDEKGFVEKKGTDWLERKKWKSNPENGNDNGLERKKQKIKAN